MLVASVLFCTNLHAAPINSIAYGSITGTGFVNFEDLAHVAAPGTNYNGIFASGGTQFAERFVGQTLSFSGSFDVLSGCSQQPARAPSRRRKPEYQCF